MKYRYTLFLLTVLVININKALSQIVGDNIFLQGAFVEIGIAPNGGYGSTVNAPTGYHPNNPGGDIFYDPAAGASSSLSSNLGFVADYGKDGWTVGTPPYFGDFYLPGDPQEGWAVEINGEESDAYIPIYETAPTTGFTGGLSGTNVSYSNSGGVIKGVWEGVDTTTSGGKLKIRQTTILDTSKLYFTVNVVFINTGTTTLSNIYYLRTVDPDNDETQSGGGFTTINTISDQLPNLENKVLVSATGQHFTNAYLGLGTKDCRAKCMIYGGAFSNLSPEFSIDSLYNRPSNTDYYYAVGHCDTDDVGIGLDYKIGSLAAGDSTTITYAYILNASYIDSALNATEPAFVVNSIAYDSVDTINTCVYLTDTVAVTLQNAGFYNWSWLPHSYIEDTSGISNVIYSDSITGSITYTITGTNPAGACNSIKYYLTVTHTVFPGPPAPAVSYCLNDMASPLTATDTFPKTWWTLPVGGDSSTTPPIPSTTTAGVTYYYVSEVRDSSCRSRRSIDTITILPLPIPPTISDPNPYCQGQTFVPFTVSTSNVLWYGASAGGFGSTIAPVINTGIPGIYNFYASDIVRDTVITGGHDTSIVSCESPRESIAITVKDSLLPAFTTHLFYGCTSDTVIFNNTTFGAETYFWNLGDGTNDMDTDPTHVYTTQGTYSVTLTAINGACEESVTDTIPIYHHLKAGFTYDPGIICQQSPVNFINNSLGIGLSFTWLLGNGTTDTSTNINYTYTKAGTYNVMLITKDFVPCFDTATALIQVDTQSSANIALSDTVICQGTYVTFTGLYSDTGKIGETWFLGNGDSIKNENSISYAYKTPGTYISSISVLYRACKDTGASRKIVVLPQPQIDLGHDTSICPGSATITLVDNINVENPSATWLWSTGQTTPGITVVAPGYYSSTVSINNCSATDTVWVQNDCYMDIPNAFTPNNDGINDYFFPRQLLSKGLITFKMYIYNRWGQLIFETSSLDGAGWDGKLNNVLQPEGVYVYVIDGTFKDGQKEHHQGNVSLLR